MFRNYLKKIQVVLSTVLLFIFATACDRASIIQTGDLQEEKTSDACLPGQQAINGLCAVLTVCDEGQVLKNDVCVAIRTPIPALTPTPAPVLSPTPSPTPAPVSALSPVPTPPPTPAPASMPASGCLVDLLTAPIREITSEAELRAIQPGFRYQLKKDIPLVGASPVLVEAEKFALYGEGHTISNITTDGSQALNGLFGRLGCTIIQDLHLANIQVKGELGIVPFNGEFVGAGALAGVVYGDNYFGSITVAGGKLEGKYQLGGLLGWVYAPPGKKTLIENIEITLDIGIIPQLGAYLSPYRYGSTIGGLAAELNGEGVTVRKVSVTGNIVGVGRLGGLAGGFEQGLIEDSHFTGTIKGTSWIIPGNGSEAFMIGGIFGESAGGTLRRSYAIGQVSGESFVGGLGGLINSESSMPPVLIEDCYARVELSAPRPSLGNAGGLFGLIRGRAPSNAVIRRSFSTGEVKGTEYCGGLIGQLEFSDPAVVEQSYWNVETSSQSHSAGNAVGLSTSQMRSAANFIGWDFTNIWFSPTASSFPTLR